MLIVISSMRELKFGMLMQVYEEGNRENGSEFYPDFSAGQQLIRAEQDFYQYLQECFFQTEDAVYAVWAEDGQYVSALRLEPFRDGLLLEALETMPSKRRKGYASMLVCAVQKWLAKQGSVKIYSHVAKRNQASMAVHLQCGFRRILDHAVYADGSVLTNAYTFCWECE